MRLHEKKRKKYRYINTTGSTHLFFFFFFLFYPSGGLVKVKLKLTTLSGITFATW